MDVNDIRDRLNIFRARFGAGPTSMTDEQIEEMSEHYRPKKEISIAIFDDAGVIYDQDGRIDVHTNK